jgi:two-component SAPR family response regulator
MLEDNPSVGFVLQELITDIAKAGLVRLRSVAAAEKELVQSHFDLAFLDINVTHGKTYAIAASLINKGIPFAFISGFVRRDDVPENLRHVPFLAKPYRPAQIKHILGTFSG